MVHILRLDAVFLQIIRQILGHLDGKRCDECALATVNAGADLAQQVLDLALHRAHHDKRVQQAGGADDLLRHAAGMLAFIFTGGCRNKNLLMDFGFKFFKFQRAVVKRRRQTEAVFDQRFLAAVVAAEHTAHLRQHDVALVDHQQEIIREIIQQRCGRGAGRTA